ncbi:hypothetical protein [Listeria fleischmannii]|uniref:Major capsid protein Gp34/ORF3-like protein n=1 Tax=Listeria fleischmannii FSL S10-1203 TaxID=1265822 RepID=W7DS60_9LIST|nr:hypothetical protein [Listeria fleischmannii]EUJ64735.1 major capsid protein Gp34/ORF3-like protein [Listeria fleischmannii FSL S10-1203]
MPVILDNKDLAKLDQEFAADSQVWEVLKQGGQDIDESDFVGAKEVRVNKMTGFTVSDYKRNAVNARNKINMEKETRKLEKERWMGYDLDALDQSENGSYDVTNVLEQHVRLIAIPEKDQTAVSRLLENAGKNVVETVTTANSLAVYDAAEQYMTDQEIVGPFVMFVSSDFYLALKNNEKVSKTFTTNEVKMNGINRKVAQLDNEIPIIKVAKKRLQVDESKKINFIFVPLRIAAPIEKYNDVTLIPSKDDRDGYRDTIKGLNYYDLIVFDNAKKAIYVSYEEVEVIPEG